MNPFPSPVERIVASALLLLSETAPSSSPSSPRLGSDDGSVMIRERSENNVMIRERSENIVMIRERSENNVMIRERDENKSSSEESFSFVSSVSKSQCSDVSNHSSSFLKIQKEHNVRMVTSINRSHEMKFKVVRKRRSTVCWSSIPRKTVLALPSKVSSKSESTDVSCLSSTSSASSNARSSNLPGVMRRNQMEPKPKKTQVNSARSSTSSYLHRQAEAILKLLSRGCSSEVRIRKVLGDSPDTSKALRMLLKQEEIKRSGSGGRQDPYIYKIA